MLLRGWLLRYGQWEAFAVLILPELLIGISILTILNVMNLLGRFKQTLSAYFGTHILRETLFVVLLLLLPASFLPTSIVTIWAVAVFGYILHKSLDIKLTWGILAAFLVALFAAFVVTVLFTGYFESLYPEIPEEHHESHESH